MNPQIIFGILFILTVSVVILLICRAKQQRYDNDMNLLDEAITHWQVNQCNYDEINNTFDRVYRNNLDPNRTKKLKAKFMVKYYKFFKAEIVKRRMIRERKLITKIKIDKK